MLCISCFPRGSSFLSGQRCPSVAFRQRCSELTVDASSAAPPYLARAHGILPSGSAPRSNNPSPPPAVRSTPQNYCWHPPPRTARCYVDVDCIRGCQSTSTQQRLPDTSRSITTRRSAPLHRLSTAAMRWCRCSCSHPGLLQDQMRFGHNGPEHINSGSVPGVGRCPCTSGVLLFL